MFDTMLTPREIPHNTVDVVATNETIKKAIPTITKIRPMSLLLT